MRDVVQQIKCELMHAVVAPIDNKDLKWFRYWTAKIDLTLNVSTLNQITPTVVLNHPLHNAYPNVGTSSLPGTALSAFQQKFTFGIGGGVSDERTRSEDFSFTVTFLGLEQDFRELSLRDTRYADCLNPNVELVGSNLDIKSWIDKRVLPLVVPIDGYQVLTEGYHKQVSVAAVKQPPTLPIHGNFAVMEGVPKATAAAEQAAADVTYISKEVLPLAQKIGDVCTTKINSYQKDAITQEGAASDALAGAIAAQANGDSAGLVKSVNAAVAAQEIADARAKSAHDTIKDPKACMPPPKDPPLDLVTASYQFEIAANVGVAPSWTLVKVTGPSGTGSAASTAGAWTNNVSIILAPAVSSTNPDVNTERLIQTLRPPPAPAPAGAF